LPSTSPSPNLPPSSPPLIPEEWRSCMYTFCLGRSYASVVKCIVRGVVRACIWSSFWNFEMNALVIHPSFGRGDNGGEWACVGDTYFFWLQMLILIWISNKHTNFTVLDDHRWTPIFKWDVVVWCDLN
jgi:hypothetical protein